MPITLLDGILLGITLVSAILAMVRGFSREVLSVVSWAAAATILKRLKPGSSHTPDATTAPEPKEDIPPEGATPKP